MDRLVDVLAAALCGGGMEMFDVHQAHHDKAQQVLAALDSAGYTIVAKDAWERASQFRFPVHVGEHDELVETITIEWRSEGKWAVKNGSRTLRRSGKWDYYEPQPSSRTDSYKDRTRFTLEEALPLARKAHAERLKLWEMRARILQEKAEKEVAE